VDECMGLYKREGNSDSMRCRGWQVDEVQEDVPSCACVYYDNLAVRQVCA
jgi:hypothetical protein